MSSSGFLTFDKIFGGPLSPTQLLLKQAQSVKTPDLQEPPAPPQASKAPDAGNTAAMLAGAGQANGTPGVAQTFLNGPGGIDPSLLKLGKTTLLGG
jgi:hypothetical protein